MNISQEGRPCLSNLRFPVCFRLQRGRSRERANQQPKSNWHMPRRLRRGAAQNHQRTLIVPPFQNGSKRTRGPETAFLTSRLRNRLPLLSGSQGSSEILCHLSVFGIAPLCRVGSTAISLGRALKRTTSRLLGDHEWRYRSPLQRHLPDL